VAQSALRCPFCHGTVEVAARDWVACRTCLARHHAACWQDGKTCASCGGRERLVEAPGQDDGASRGFIEAIARLDDAWAERRRLLYSRTASGYFTPSRYDVRDALIAAVGGLIVFYFGVALDMPTAVVFGLGATLVAGASAIRLKRRLDAYSEAEATYLKRRAELAEALARVRSGVF
jgi:hypothetical protein